MRTVDTTGPVFAGTPADITYTCAGDVPVANTAAVTVTVANARGCETTVPFIVNRALDIIPALFFSPNNDGVNDTWEIENIGHYPHAIIEIYDRFSKHLITYKGKRNWLGWDVFRLSNANDRLLVYYYHTRVGQTPHWSLYVKKINK